MELLEEKINRHLIQDTRYLPMWPRQMIYLWDIWRKECYGSGSNWFSTVEHIKHNFHSDANIAVSEDNSVLVIVTPLMKRRTHMMIPQSKEILFMDTTSNTDNYNTSVTFLMTASPIGGMPLGPSSCQKDKMKKVIQQECYYSKK